MNDLLPLWIVLGVVMSVVGPSLGQDSIHKGAMASLVGSLAVFLFVMFYYRVSGVIAVFSLVLNVLFVLASLVGYSIFNGLLSRYPASSVVPFVLIAPPVAMASAWALLGQSVNAAEALGGLVVLAGVLVTVAQPRAAQGTMLKLRRNTLSGSQARLAATSRSSVSGG